MIRSALSAASRRRPGCTSWHTEPGTISRRVGRGRSRPDAGRHHRARERRHRDRPPRGSLQACADGRRDAGFPEPAARSSHAARPQFLGRSLYGAGSPRPGCVIARLLGGSGYWPYGVERLVATCRDQAIPLALLPGDDKPDAELARLSTMPPESAVAGACGATSPRAARPMPRIFCAMPRAC